MSADLIAVVEEHVDLYGEPLVLQIPNPGNYDVDTGTYTPGAPTTVNFDGFVSPFSTENAEGSHVQLGDLKVIAAGPAFTAAGVVPESGHRVTRGGRTYELVHADLHPIAGVLARVVLQLRGTEA